MQYFECDQNAVDAYNLVKTCFLVFVLTWERLSFASQTHNSNLLGPQFSAIFNIQKCNKIVVFWDSTDASEKVDLLLFLWSARLVETYTKTSFIKNVFFFDTFQCSIQFRKSHKKFNIYNIFCIINKNWTFLIEQYWFKCILFLTFFHFCVLPAWWKHTQRPLLTKLEAFESSKFEKLEKADFAHFVSCPLGGNVHKDLFWQNEGLLKALSLKILKKQTLLILWAARLVETYTKTSFDKIEAFESSKLEKANVTHFVSCPLGRNVHKDFFWRNRGLLKVLIDIKH